MAQESLVVADDFDPAFLGSCDIYQVCFSSCLTDRDSLECWPVDARTFLLDVEQVGDVGLISFAHVIEF